MSPPDASVQLDRYRLIRELGRGGMGVVYEAVDEALQRVVALKVMTVGAPGDPRTTDRFHHEALIAARLSHPGIVPVFGSGVCQGVHYIVFQKIDGISLDKIVSVFPLGETGELTSNTVRQQVARILEKYPVPTLLGSESDRPQQTETSLLQESSSSLLKESPENPNTAQEQGDNKWLWVAEVGRCVATALQHAHERGIIHRDIKPSNLLVDRRSQVWVTDFGLAQASSLSVLTGTGDLLGTLRYMSPEQVTGQRTAVDHRTDIYSLGVVLYELASGVAAFSSHDRTALLQRILQETPRSIHKIVPKIPRDLATIIDRAMAKLPADRFMTAGEFAADLSRFLDGLPIVAQPPTLWDWSRYYAWKYRSLIGVTLGILVFFLTGWVIVGRQHGNDLQVQIELLQDARRDTTRREWQTLISLAARTRSTRLPAQRRESLKSLEEAARLRPAATLTAEERSQIRNEAIASLAIPIDIVLDSHYEFPTAVTYTHVDPSFQRILRVRPNTTILDIYQLNPAGLPVKLVRSIDTALGNMSLVMPSPSLQESTVIVAAYHTSPAYWGGGVWDYQTGKHLGDLPESKTIVWSPDGKLVACLLENRNVSIYRSENWSLIANWTFESEADGSSTPDISWRPGTSELAVISGQSLLLTDPLTGQIRDRQTISRTGVSSSEWTPNGRLLILGDGTGVITVWDIERRAEHQVLTSQKLTAWSVSPAGNFLATASVSEDSDLWKIDSGLPLMRLTGRPVAFDQSAQRFATCTSTKWMMWSIERSPVFRPVLPAMHFQQELLDAGLSPDGHWLVATSEIGISLTNLQTGIEVNLPRLGTRSAQFARREGKVVLIVSDSKISVTEFQFDPLHGALGESQLIYPRQEQPQPGVGLAEFTLNRRWIAIGSNNAPVVIDRESERVFPLESQLNLHRLTASPDGRWAVGGLFHGRGINLWDVQQGKITRQLWDTQPHSQSAFSDDGQWLAVSSSEGTRVWETKTWTQVLSRLNSDSSDLPSPVAFSPNSEILLFSENQTDLLVFSTSEWKQLAVLKSPDPAYGGVMRFSPDGNKLVRTSVSEILVWDLAKLRSELQALGLDWSPSESSR